MRVRSRFVSRLLLFVMFTLMAAVVIPVASAPKASAEVTDCATVNTAISEVECLALVALYDSTNGAGWTNNTGWIQDDPCAWYGVTCSGVQVTQLSLGNNNLSGSIPTEIGNLTGLTHVYLWGNALSGAIPTEIGNLTGLIKLQLDGNALSGPIPSSIGNLTSLTRLALDVNALSGEVPSSITNLTNLTNLYLGGNGCLWASVPVTTFVTGLGEGWALNDACKPAPAPAPVVVCGALCEGVTVLVDVDGVSRVQVPSGLMGLLDLSVPVSLQTNPVVFEGLLPSDGIISFTYPDGFGPVFTFGATLINGGYGGNYTSTVTILPPTTVPAAATETETADADADTAADAVAAAVAVPVLAFTGTGSGLTQLALAITGAGALMMTASRRRR